MFNFVRKRKRVVQVIMVIATLPFLFWGIDSYRNTSGEDYVALVAGEKIHRQEFDQALRTQQEIMRENMGDSFNVTMLDDPEIRYSVLEGLIQRRLLNREAARIGLAILDSQLRKEIKDISVFQQDGEFSMELYKELLRNQGMDVVMFESRVRQDMMRQQVVDAYTKNGFISDTVAKNIIRLSEEKREISRVQIQPEQFLSQIKPNNDAIKSYYDSHQTKFRQPEQVRVEYLVLSVDGLAKEVQVSIDETIRYFDEHKAEFGQVEERRASHILLIAPTTASDTDKAAARAKAEELLSQLKQSPQSFADLARQYSQDAGTADKGGDLGFLGRGELVKAFEDEIFQMEAEEIRGPVQTDFGFHIIKLSAIKAGEIVNFDEVRNQVEEKLRKQKAGKEFGEMAEEFRNMVYEQSDSLQPAAEAFRLPIQQSGWISRKEGKPSYFTNGKLLQAIFSEDSIKNKRNTESIEVTPDTLISARVLDHRPAAMRSINVVREEITKLVVRQQATDRAVKEGMEKLERLQKGEKNVVEWSPTQQVSHNEPQGLDYEILRSIFKTRSTGLPVYTGIINPQGGFSLIRISDVIESAPP
ncbi:MAG: SurA N-terminal domain-containing protein, partial [Proteobacteria bacterium]|nr:SurA N-terminal domain-containing protein [Pseudomonadota bacterium]